VYMLVQPRGRRWTHWSAAGSAATEAHTTRTRTAPTADGAGAFARSVSEVSLGALRHWQGSLWQLAKGGPITPTASTLHEAATLSCRM